MRPSVSPPAEWRPFSHSRAKNLRRPLPMERCGRLVGLESMRMDASSRHLITPDPRWTSKRSHDANYSASPSLYDQIGDLKFQAPHAGGADFPGTTNHRQFIVVLLDLAPRGRHQTALHARHDGFRDAG